MFTASSDTGSWLGISDVLTTNLGFTKTLKVCVIDISSPFTSSEFALISVTVTVISAMP